MQKCLKIQKACMVFLYYNRRATLISILNVSYTSIAYVSNWKWLWEYAEIDFCVHGKATKFHQLGIYQHFLANKLGSKIQHFHPEITEWFRNLYLCASFFMKYLSKDTKKLSVDTKQISRLPLMRKTVFLLPCNQGNNYTTA